MRLLLAGCLALVLIVVAIPIQANESWVLYDDFNGTPLEFLLGKPIDPGNWVPTASDTTRIYDYAREIRWNKLHLLNRTYGFSNLGSSTSTSVRLQFPPNLAPLITAMQATVTVTSFEVSGGGTVGIEFLPSRIRGGRLSGFFFNDIDPNYGRNYNAGDILAAIYIEGLSDSPQTLRVVAHVEHCFDDDAFCNNSNVIFKGDLGTIRAGETARLAIQWDSVKGQFLFQRGYTQALYPYPYTGNVSESYNPAKRIDVSHRAVSNGTGEVPVAAMDVLVDDVCVNASALSAP